jgi:ketosteroid isomerase-like protein
MAEKSSTSGSRQATRVELEVVQHWQDAVNARDVPALMAWSNPKIEIVGPRGSAFGQDMLRQWLERASLSLSPQQSFQRDQTVVVAQHAVWRSAESEIVGEADVASVFRIENDKVLYYARFDSLEEALQQGGLTEDDET